MGVGIAQVFAEQGFAVTSNDINGTALKRAASNIEASLGVPVRKGRMEQQERDQALERLVTTENIANMRHADLIIEAASEDEALKTKIFNNLTSHLAHEGHG